ncbi:MAG TPA: L,D-transpeptidase [Xanthobacteraceae bacterium]|nr:L,D-transpeptidase [Xanthobacteraceae bacterium]
MARLGPADTVRVLSAWLGAATLCLLSPCAPAQMLPPQPPPVQFPGAPPQQQAPTLPAPAPPQREPPLARTPVPAPTEEGGPVFKYPFTETMKDVDPGIDHGNSDANLPEEFKKQVVIYRSPEAPGTIIIDTRERHLYLIQDESHAVRYGIGVGRVGFTWQGLLQVTRKAEWPDWHPPPEMVERQPYLPRFMAGGPGNPLGARALYLGETEYRIHGTNAPETIGQAVSSGCFRLVNDDVVDLYDRVQVGTKVIVRQE